MRLARSFFIQNNKAAREREREREKLSLPVVALMDAASLRSFAKRKAEELFHCGVLQSWGLETFGPFGFLKLVTAGTF